MSGMDLDKVEPDLLASFNGCNKSVFDTLYIVFGHRNGFSVILGEGYIAWTVNYSTSRVNESNRGASLNHKPLFGQPPSSSSASCLGALKVFCGFS